VAPVRVANDSRSPGPVVANEWVDPAGAHAQAPTPEAQLEGAAPGAMRGLDRAVVPRGYREQVRDYFGQR
jgi:hypothetical protein